MRENRAMRNFLGTLAITASRHWETESTLLTVSHPVVDTFGVRSQARLDQATFCGNHQISKNAKEGLLCETTREFAKFLHKFWFTMLRIKSYAGARRSIPDWFPIDF